MAAHQAPRPWDSPGKNTGVGCHFLLQCMRVKSESEVAQSCPTLSDPMDCSPPGSSVHGIFQARVLECVPLPFPTERFKSSDFQSRNSFTLSLSVFQSCPTLCDPMDRSPPGFSVHGILLARILELVAIPFSRISSRPRDRTPVFHIAGRLLICLSL